MNTSVILACVKQLDSNNEVTEDELRTVFGSFANVVDIFIFEHEPLVKAFVQFENEDIAAKVIETFNERLFSIGSMRLYISRKNNINCKKKRWLRFSQKCQLPKSVNDTDPTSNNYVVWSDFKNEFPLNVPLSTSIKETNVRSPGFDWQHRPVVPTQAPNLSLSMPSNRDYHPQVHIQSTHEAKSFKANLDLNNPLTKDFKTLLSGSHKLFESFGFEIRNVSSKLMNKNTLLNLFSFSGTAINFTMDITTESVAVSFAIETECLRARAFLRGLELFGSKIAIVNTQPKSSTAKIMNGNIRNDPSDSYDSDEDDHRLSEQQSLSHLKRSNLIRFDNLPHSCTPVILYDIVSQIHEPLTITRLTERATKTSFFSVKFENFLMSLEVLIVLNKKRIDGNVISVSFVHSNSFT
jgi:RNA recognition motif-containing protein